MKLISLMLSSLISTTYAATGHEHYPAYCCAGKDCGPISDGFVRELADGRGYLILLTGEVIPYNSLLIKGQSLDGKYHRCTLSGPLAKTKTKCFWPKGGGV